MAAFGFKPTYLSGVFVKVSISKKRDAETQSQDMCIVLYTAYTFLTDF